MVTRRVFLWLLTTLALFTGGSAFLTYRATKSLVSSAVSIKDGSIGLSKLGGDALGTLTFASTAATEAQNLSKNATALAQQSLKVSDVTGKIDPNVLPTPILNSLKLKGQWNAATNTPKLSDKGGGGVQGDYYVVNVAGSTPIDGNSVWAVGDCITNNGTVWGHVLSSNIVSSVNGQQGKVTLTTDDIAQNLVNKYFSDALARGALSSIGPIAYSATTGTIDCPTCVINTGNGGLTTTSGDIVTTGLVANRLIGAGDVNIDLSPTGVTAGSYGTTASIPVFTVDAKGRITAVANTNISGLTSANLSATAGITNQQLANSAISVTAGVGLTGGGSLQLGSGGAIAISAPACTSNERLSWNGSAFSCGAVAVGTVTNANTLYAGPASGAAGTPAFRSIVSADLGAGTANNQSVLKGNLSWVQIFDGSGKIDTSLLPASILGSLKFKGLWNASANTPALTNSAGGGVEGDFYIVDVAGTTSVDGHAVWAVGDWIVNNGTIGIA